MNRLNFQFPHHWLRRVVIITCLSLISLCITPNSIAATINPTDQPTPSIVSYRSPTCGCCEEWVKRMQTAGFAVEDHITEDIDRVKARYGVPTNLTSCHTAIANGYVIEGHVPPADIQRLMQTAPPAVMGLAAPGMPSGSPGMESEDTPPQSYNVYSFTQTGELAIFQAHPA
ncbi:DUF411 domain-containing protein [filamentous cyanobacterium LEGE 11480]|uniref:DUF411 domain-containing protein n=1 Tax=Romeriopsis navalis LEGE 11480 TaxID=2777977 RepID=A0A928VL61_9CYAN|nr:DUF411 domain-containing protein [Romeriopsis navalis]MBE9030330.1 DUF411 domain-containing protein [Romeriopsis navalis LEGE 11480]